jgi:hypothetical protein
VRLLILNIILQAADSCILMVIYFKYRLWQPNKKSTYSFIYRNGIIQIINLAAIATVYLNLKDILLTDYHFMSALFLSFLLVPFF